MDLKEILTNNYDISILNIEKNNKSTAGNVYMIYTKKEEYVVKIYSDFSLVESMVYIHNTLSENDFYVPSIIKSKNNNYYIKDNDKYIIIYSFLTGISLGEKYEKIPNDVIEKLALEVRRMHTLLKDKKDFLKPLSFYSNKKVDRYSALHFDLTRYNIFCFNDKIGFIDFDDAKYGLCFCDVAILICLLFLSRKRGVDLDSINLFLDTYYTDKTLMKREIKYIKEFSLKWVDYIISVNNFDSSIELSFIKKRELIEKYINF